jgi:hypothetical protein
MDFRIEELSMNAWPAFRTRLYDGWVLRTADGYTMRSNSVYPLYPSRLPLARKIAYCESVYAAAGLSAAFKLVGCEEHAALERELGARDTRRTASPPFGFWRVFRPPVRRRRESG